jgi:hypothetical protein
MGSCRVACRGGARSLGVGKGVVVIEEKGEGEESGKSLGLLLSPSRPTEYDKGKNFSKILRIQRERDPSRSPSFSWSV